MYCRELDFTFHARSITLITYKRLATEVQRVLTIQRKVIAKVNLLGQKQKEMFGSINALIETTNRQ